MNIAIIINNGDTNDHITIIPFSGGIWILSLKVIKSNFYHWIDTSRAIYSLRLGHRQIIKLIYIIFHVEQATS
jgi:hypothetical protein